jgi:hypothetical protein
MEGSSPFPSGEFQDKQGPNRPFRTYPFMPRRSAQEIAALDAVDTPRLSAPPHLSEEQQEDWRQITSQFPASHFDGANSCLLEQLIVHIDLARRINEQLHALRQAKSNAATAHGAKVRSTFCELLAAHRQQSIAIVQLCTKLRLSNSSHRNDRVDERKLTTLPSGPPPWARQHS